MSTDLIETCIRLCKGHSDEEKIVGLMHVMRIVDGQIDHDYSAVQLNELLSGVWELTGFAFLQRMILIKSSTNSKENSCEKVQDENYKRQLIIQVLAICMLEKFLQLESIRNKIGGKCSDMITCISQFTLSDLRYDFYFAIDKMGFFRLIRSLNVCLSLLLTQTCHNFICDSKPAANAHTDTHSSSSAPETMSLSDFNHSSSSDENFNKTNSSSVSARKQTFVRLATARHTAINTLLHLLTRLESPLSHLQSSTASKTSSSSKEAKPDDSAVASDADIISLYQFLIIGLRDMFIFKTFFCIPPINLSCTSEMVETSPKCSHTAALISQQYHDLISRLLDYDSNHAFTDSVLQSISKLFATQQNLIKFECLHILRLIVHYHIISLQSQTHQMISHRDVMHDPVPNWALDIRKGIQDILVSRVTSKVRHVAIELSCTLLTNYGQLWTTLPLQPEICHDDISGSQSKSSSSQSSKASVHATKDKDGTQTQFCSILLNSIAIEVEVLMSAFLHPDKTKYTDQTLICCFRITMLYIKYLVEEEEQNNQSSDQAQKPKGQDKKRKYEQHLWQSFKAQQVLFLLDKINHIMKIVLQFIRHVALLSTPSSDSADGQASNGNDCEKSQVHDQSEATQNKFHENVADLYKASYQYTPKQFKTPCSLDLHASVEQVDNMLDDISSTALHAFWMLLDRQMKLSTVDGVDESNTMLFQSVLLLAKWLEEETSLYRNEVNKLLPFIFSIHNNDRMKVIGSDVSSLSGQTERTSPACSEDIIVHLLPILVHWTQSFVEETPSVEHFLTPWTVSHVLAKFEIPSRLLHLIINQEPVILTWIAFKFKRSKHSTTTKNDSFDSSLSIQRSNPSEMSSSIAITIPFKRALNMVSYASSCMREMVDEIVRDPKCAYTFAKHSSCVNLLYSSPDFSKIKLNGSSVLFILMAPYFEPLCRIFSYLSSRLNAVDEPTNNNEALIISNQLLIHTLSRQFSFVLRLFAGLNATILPQLVACVSSMTLLSNSTPNSQFSSNSVSCKIDNCIVNFFQLCYTFFNRKDVTLQAIGEDLWNQCTEDLADCDDCIGRIESLENANCDK
jgi:hypothetical protein